jgi:hypothetical protein
MLAAQDYDSTRNVGHQEDGCLECTYEKVVNAIKMALCWWGKSFQKPIFTL